MGSLGPFLKLHLKSCSGGSLKLIVRILPFVEWLHAYSHLAYSLKNFFLLLPGETDFGFDESHNFCNHDGVRMLMGFCDALLVNMISKKAS